MCWFYELITWMFLSFTFDLWNYVLYLILFVSTHYKQSGTFRIRALIDSPDCGCKNCATTVFLCTEVPQKQPKHTQVL